MSREMNDRESFERFVEGLKKAASCARQLAIAQKNNSWYSIASSLDDLRRRGEELFGMKAMGRLAVEQFLTRKAAQLNTDKTTTLQ